jgi:hypothetical protein
MSNIRLGFVRSPVGTSSVGPCPCCLRVMVVITRLVPQRVSEWNWPWTQPADQCWQSLFHNGTQQRPNRSFVSEDVDVPDQNRPWSSWLVDCSHPPLNLIDLLLLLGKIIGARTLFGGVPLLGCIVRSCHGEPILRRYQRLTGI